MRQILLAVLLTVAGAFSGMSQGGITFVNQTGSEISDWAWNAGNPIALNGADGTFQPGEVEQWQFEEGGGSYSLTLKVDGTSYDVASFLNVDTLQTYQINLNLDTLAGWGGVTVDMDQFKVLVPEPSTPAVFFSMVGLLITSSRLRGRVFFWGLRGRLLQSESSPLCDGSAK